MTSNFPEVEPGRLLSFVLAVILVVLWPVHGSAADDKGSVAGQVVLLPAADPVGTIVIAVGEGIAKRTIDNKEGTFENFELRARIKWTFTAVRHNYKTQNQVKLLVASGPGNKADPIELRQSNPAESMPVQPTARVVLVMVPQVLPQVAETSGQRPSCSQWPATYSGTISSNKQGAKTGLQDAEVSLYALAQDSDARTLLAQRRTGKDGKFALEISDRQRLGTLDYLVTVVSDGHEPAVILLEPSECLPDDIALSVADPEEEDGSDARLTQVEVTEPTRRFIVSPRMMESLPLAPRRSFDAFALLVPGVLPPPQSVGRAGPGISGGIGTAGQFAVNGLRSRENNFTIDGSDNNDEDIGTRRQGFISLVPQPVETLGELQIITSVPDAAFGRNIGGQINALSALGGRGVHGSLFAFLNNHKLNAPNSFEAPIASLRSSRNDREFGFVLGGPVRFGSGSLLKRGRTDATPLKSDNTFFFASIDRINTGAKEQTHFAVPSVEERGIFRSGATGLRVTDSQGRSSAMFPAGLPGNAIFSLYPFPNNASGPYGKNTFTSLLDADGKSTRYTITADHLFRQEAKQPDPSKPQASISPDALTRFLSDDVLTIRFNFSDERSILPVTGRAILSTIEPKIRIHNVSSFYNRQLGGRTADTIRLSFGKSAIRYGEVLGPDQLKSTQFPGTSFLLNAPLLLNVTTANTGPVFVNANSVEGKRIVGALGYDTRNELTTEQITGPLGQVMIGGFSPVGVDVFNFPQRRDTNTFQVGYTLSHSGGPNSLVAGIDVRRGQIKSVLDRNFRPLASFNGLPGLEADH